MASKKYAYFHKGNQIAITQKSDGGSLSFKDSDGNIITRGTSSSENFGQYQSPKQQSLAGLEIEYSYAPVYNFNGGDAALNANLSTSGGGQSVFGWSPSSGSGNYLNIWLNPTVNWNSVNYQDEIGQENQNPNIADSILITGNSQWNGVHKLSVVSTYGGSITTHTKVNKSFQTGWGQLKCSITRTDATTISEAGLDNGFIKLFPNKNETYYMALGLTGEQTSQDYYYEIQRTDDSTLKVNATWSFTNGVWTRNSSVALDPYDPTTGSIDIYRIERANNVYMFGGNTFTVLEDETFDLNLSRIEAEAVVYYIKAKLGEDIEDFKKREYYMRLFKKSLEKARGNKSPGVRLIQGHWSMR